MARCLFQNMYESRGIDSKRTVKDEAGVLRTDSVEVLFQRCFTFTFLYACSIRMLHSWGADTERDLECRNHTSAGPIVCFSCYTSDMYDMDGMLLGPPR